MLSRPLHACRAPGTPRAEAPRGSHGADTCAICRNKLYEPSIEAQASAPLPPLRTRRSPLVSSDAARATRLSRARTPRARPVCDSQDAALSPRPTDGTTASSVADPGLADDAGYSIAWGCCGHVFHLDCISRWLKTRSVCPLCNREWEFAKIEKIATYGNLD